MRRSLMPMACFMTLTGCITYAGQRDSEVASSAALVADVGSRLELDFPAGDIRVQPSGDDRLHATARFFCSGSDDRCRENASRAKIVLNQSGDRSVLSFKPGSAYSNRHANVVYEVSVPGVEALKVRVPAGDVDIDSPTGCLDARVKAGELSIRAPASDVRSVSLRARVGDASLSVPGGGEDDRRPLLVGASVDWEDGWGDCALRAALIAGDISARLR